MVFQPQPSSDPLAPFASAGPDLSGANIRRAKLQGISFSQTNLSGANLEEADLENATFSLATLNDACLKGAMLKRAQGLKVYAIRTDLSHSYMGHAWFANAQMSNANLSAANLEHAVLRSADLKNANMSEANLAGADLAMASFELANLQRSRLNIAIALGTNFKNANLQAASLYATQLMSANFVAANLQNAAMTLANLSSSDLTSADLRGARLDGANLCGANLTRADLTGCFAYGVSVWDANLTDTIQKDISLVPQTEPTQIPQAGHITVADISTAQLIYMVRENGELRRILAGLQSNMVLLLGRFTPEGLVTLRALREVLSKLGLIPQTFEFAPLEERTRMETVAAMAHLARFVIADISGARSVPAELECIVPQLPNLPIRLLLKVSDQPFGMIEGLLMRPSVVLTRYSSAEDLAAGIEDIVACMDQKREALAAKLADLRKMLDSI